jgi:PAS domain S-box-containing protein
VQRRVRMRASGAGGDVAGFLANDARPARLAPPLMRWRTWQATLPTSSRWWNTGAQFAVGILGVAALTSLWLSRLLQSGDTRQGFSFATIGFSYLILIAPLSIAGSFVGSILVSLIAAGCLAYFFTPSLPLFDVDHAADAAALVGFITTSTVVSGLAAKLRQRSDEREASRKAIIETIPALIWTASADGLRDFHNRRWLEFTGLSAEEAAGDGWISAIHPEDRGRALETWRRATQSGEPFEDEARFRSARGEYRSFLARAQPMREASGAVAKWYGSTIDIEEQKRIREALRESEQRFRDYAETTSDWFWETGPDHRFTTFRGTVAGIDVSSIWGATRWELANDLEEEPEKWRTHRVALDAHLPFRGFTYELAHPDGVARYISTSGKPLFDRGGHFLGYRGTSADVTATVRAAQAEKALAAARAELAHMARITTLGELTASIAHEINQPLAAVVTDAGAALRWLSGHVPNLEEARQALQRIVKDGHRASDVIQRIRALARKSPTQAAPLDINELILSVIALTRSEVQRNRILLRTELTGDLPIVHGDWVQLQQVMLNLIMNAIEAMIAAGPRDVVIASAKRDEHGVIVAVRDSGPGVDEEVLHRLFDPFYTTKAGGMGMGLAISRSIIDAHGGRLWASANAPRGAVFQFTLPAKVASVVSVAAPDAVAKRLLKVSDASV